MEPQITPTLESTSVSPTEVEKPTQKVKLILILTILLIISTLFAGFFYFQTQKFSKELLKYQSLTAPPVYNDTISNWKTYSNLSPSFSFKYPLDWTIDDEQIFGSRKEINFRYNQTTTLTLTVSANYNNETGNPFTTLDEYLGTRALIANDINIGNIKAKLVIDPGKEGHVVPYQEVVLFLTGNSTNILSFYYQKDFYNNPQSENVLSQILSTFIFPPETSEGKFCGGIAANLLENQCPEGFYCKLDGKYPDAGGKCVKKW